MILANCDREIRLAERAHAAPASIAHSNARRAAILIIVFGAGFLGGCGAARPITYYQLTVPGGEGRAQSADAAPITLLVGNLMTSHLYREDRIVYSSGGGEMGMYETHRWAEPPTEMIEEFLTRELRASGRYRAVYTHRSSTSGDFLLRGHLYDFKEVSERSMMAKVTFDLELRDLKNGATVWTHYYTHEEPLSGKDVPAVVAALNKNVQRGVDEVVASLDQYFTSHPVK